MPKVTRQEDNTTGHGCFVPRPGSAQASSDVFAEQSPIVRVGDAYPAHICPSIPAVHGGSLSSGSPNVFVNDRAMGRTGDSISCGDRTSQGANTVFANN